MQKHNKLIEFEILKALLIICVVIGHTLSTPYINIFWFHMPAFFMLSGYFMREPLSNPLTNKKEWAKKIKRYVIPYFAYSILFFLIFRQESVLKNIIRVIYAGHNNITLYSFPYWFINALFIASIIFSYILYKNEKRGGK